MGDGANQAGAGAMRTGSGTERQRPRRGDSLTLEIESLAFGGKGVARDNGYVVFVAGALPGDRVRAEVTKSKRSYAEARALELLEPSADRVPDRCYHGGEPCPGAPWQGLAYEEQLRHKAEQVSDSLTRLGGLEGFELEPIEPAERRWRYRNKLEYSFGEHEGELVLGFHARGRWDRVVDAEDCLLASEANNRERNSIRAWARDEGLPPYDPRGGTGALRNLVVREGMRTGQIQTRLVTSPAEIPKPPVDLHTIVQGPGSGTDGPTGVLGAELLEEELCGLRFAISHRAFFQTNSEMAERLYGFAAEYARLGAPSASSTSSAGSEPSGSPLPAPPGRSGGSRSCPRRSPTPRRTPGETGSSTPASSAAMPAESAHCWSRPGAPTSSSSIPRGRGSRRRWSAGWSSAKRRGSSTSPAIRPPSPPTPHSSLRPAIGCGA